MLTWPWVTIEWNTPPIQAVEVSAASSGVKAAGAQDMAMGPEDPPLLGLQHHVSAIASKNDSVRPSSRSTSRKFVPNKSAISVSQLQGIQEWRTGEQAGRGDLAVVHCTPAPLRIPAGPGRDRRKRDRRPQSPPDDRPQTSQRIPARPGARFQPQRCVLDRAAIECSCWRRAPGRPLTRPAGTRPARVARPWTCSASVAKLTPWPKLPITHQGWRPPMD